WLVRSAITIGETRLLVQRQCVDQNVAGFGQKRIGLVFLAAGIGGVCLLIPSIFQFGQRLLTFGGPASVFQLQTARLVAGHFAAAHGFIQRQAGLLPRFLDQRELALQEDEIGIALHPLCVLALQ